MVDRKSLLASFEGMLTRIIAAYFRVRGEQAILKDLAVAGVKSLTRQPLSVTNQAWSSERHKAPASMLKSTLERIFARATALHYCTYAN